MNGGVCILVICVPISRVMSRNLVRSLGVMMVIAFPSLPALAVLPMRCMYCWGSFGKS